MIYICAQPRTIYYAWQVEVMLNNFIKNGITPSDIHVLAAYNHNDETYSDRNIDLWNKLVEKFDNVGFYFYEDKRVDKSYIPSIYFECMRQHLLQFPNLENERLFLHDSDMLFTKSPDFSDLIPGDTWYLSDTIGYIGYQYIITKGEDVYKSMCDVIGIDPLIPKLLNHASGGGQHIVSGVTAAYWEKVLSDSIKLYKHFCNTEPYYKGEGYPIQKWTAGMWSLLWNAWLNGHETLVAKELDFCWATDNIKLWDMRSIFHNAGVTDSSSGMFFKGAYTNTLPYDIKLKDFNTSRGSYNYVKEIIETANSSCLK